MEFINLKAQYAAYKAEIDAALINVMTDADFILGKEVARLERALEVFTGAPHAISCANGTDALMLALMAIDIKPGDEVITPSFTFVGTAEAVAILGAKPVLVDIEPVGYTIDINQIAAKMTPKTRAIMPVSLYGQIGDMAQMNQLAEEYGKKLGHPIYVIEDAAQSFGAEYQGKKSGNVSAIACTSFFPSKPLGCYGDGGALFTNDIAIAEKMKALRIHGQTGRYHHQYVGLNSRLDTIQAAILNVKLKCFEAELERRQYLAARYEGLLQESDCVTPVTLPNRTHVYGQYSIRVKERDAIVAKLKAAGIPVAIHYHKPIHAQPCFANLGYQDADFPISMQISQEILSLPFSAFLTEAEQNQIAAVLSVG